MTSELTPKFSEQELDACKHWLLPDVSSKKIIPSAEKEALNNKKSTFFSSTKKTKEAIENTTKPSTTLSPNESIEIIEELVEPITAEQLQALSNAAEKEGFDSGFQKGLEQGIKEGKETGIQQGYDEGMAQSKKQVATQCEQLQHIMDALLIPLETEQNQLQTILLNMVAELTKAVVLRELKLDSSHITQLVDDALNTVPIGAEKFSLFLNSQDIDVVEEHVEYFQKTSDKRLVLHIDDKLLPGGCRLETQQTVVDYTVEQRLQKVVDDFLHKRFASHNTSDTDDISEESQKQNNNSVNDSVNKSDEEGLTDVDLAAVSRQDTIVEKAPSDSEKALSDSSNTSSEETVSKEQIFTKQVFDKDIPTDQTQIEKNKIESPDDYGKKENLEESHNTINGDTQ